MTAPPPKRTYLRGFASLEVKVEDGLLIIDQPDPHAEVIASVEIPVEHAEGLIECIREVLR
ncbi:MAG: hypothetical protein OXK79_09355 [Chloroflexota bacterium]|nr:hypothetical protein [Chloroflexota bacterium]